MQQHTNISKLQYCSTSPYRRGGGEVVAGNVLTVFSDKKHTIINTNRTTPYLVSTTDYDPFGMIMNGRDWNAGEYRFGFNGKEKDKETYGDGNEYDYGFRIYNPRIGKFLSVDPLTKDYPMLTPYQFSSNTPIQSIDIDGLESVYANSLLMRSTFGVAIGAISQEDINNEVERNGQMVKGMVEGSIDGVIYFVTSTGGPTAPPPFVGYGFSFENGVKPELGFFYNPTLENTFRYVGGAVDFASIALSAAEGMKSFSNIYRNATKGIAEGGAYGELTTKGMERHHIPSRSIIEEKGISKEKASAIRIKPEDHVQTGSFGNTKASRIYRKTEKELFNEGKYEEAFNMGIQDVRNLMKKSGINPKTYEKGIKQMENYFYKEILPILKNKK